MISNKKDRRNKNCNNKKKSDFERVFPIIIFALVMQVIVFFITAFLNAENLISILIGSVCYAILAIFILSDMKKKKDISDTDRAGKKEFAFRKKNIRNMISNLKALGKKSALVRSVLSEILMSVFSRGSKIFTSRKSDSETEIVSRSLAINKISASEARADKKKEIMKRGKWLAAFALLPGFSGCHLFSYGFDEYKTLDDIFLASAKFAMPYATALTLVSSVIIFGVLLSGLMRDNNIYDMILPSLVSLLIPLSSYFIAFQLFFMGYFSFTNGFFDKAPEKTHIVTVTSKKIIGYWHFHTLLWDRSTNGFVFFESWENKRDSKYLPSRFFYNNIKEQDSMTITTRKGYHGFEWIVSYKKTDSECENMMERFKESSGKEDNMIRLEGTRWKGQGYDTYNFLIRFDPGGILGYEDKDMSPSSVSKGLWKQNGSRVYMKPDDRDMEFLGFIKNDRITGYVCWYGIRRRWQVRRQ